MSRGLILIDVDETLIDTSYRLTASPDELSAAMKACEQAGFQIGLNSDSSLVDLARRAKDYRIHGPLIAEKGAIVAVHASAPPVCTLPIQQSFERLRQAFVDGFFHDSKLLDAWLLLVVDPGLGWPTPGVPTLSGPEAAILLNGTRQCSFSYVVRRWDINRWRLHPEGWKRTSGIVVDAIRRSGFELSKAEVEWNPAYGILTMHHVETSKTGGLQRLLEIQNLASITMIGNSLADWMNHPHVTHCAVGNADEAFKRKCSLVVEEQRTQGVIAILNSLAKRSG